jgi:hypothetical protein
MEKRKEEGREDRGENGRKIKGGDKKESNNERTIWNRI